MKVTLHRRNDGLYDVAQDGAVRAEGITHQDAIALRQHLIDEANPAPVLHPGEWEIV